MFIVDFAYIKKKLQIVKFPKCMHTAYTVQL